MTVAAIGLVFTVASFWFMNVRRAALRSSFPRVFAASQQSGNLRILLPVVAFNPGPAAILVQDLRLSIGAGKGEIRLPHVRTYSMMDPIAKKNDVDWAVNFPVSGRQAELMYCEFQAAHDEVVPEGFLTCRVEMRSDGRRKSWQTVVKFTLRITAQVVSQLPHDYVVYENPSR